MTIEDDGLTVPKLVHRNATEFPDRPALTTMDRSGSATLTWARLYAEVLAYARGLTALGVRPGDRVLIATSARPEHWLVDLAAAHLGAVSYAVAPTPGQDRLRHLAGDAPVTVTDGGPDGPRFRSPSDVRAAGRTTHATDPCTTVSPDDPVTLLHGLALSHRTVLRLAATLPAHAHAPAVVYRPPTHVTERLLGVYLPVLCVGHVYLCPDTSQLVTALRATRPVAFFGGPQVWARMAATVRAIVALLPDAERAAFDRALTLPVDDDVDRTVLRPIRAMLGLDDLLWAACGTSLPDDVHHCLSGVGVDVRATPTRSTPARHGTPA